MNALAKPQWAAIIIPEKAPAATSLPAGWSNEDVTGGINPTADFGEAAQVGDFVEGTFLGSRTMDLKGRNKPQSVYDLSVDGLKDPPPPLAVPFTLSVWGSVVLDRRMLEAHPEPGDRVMIQYIGLAETKQDNPAKLFMVGVKRRGTQSMSKAQGVRPGA